MNEAAKAAAAGNGAAILQTEEVVKRSRLKMVEVEHIDTLLTRERFLTMRR